MMCSITAWCETCQTEVRALGDYLGRIEGRDDYRIIDGETAEDDTHINHHEVSIQ